MGLLLQHGHFGAQVWDVPRVQRRLGRQCKRSDKRTSGKAHPGQGEDTGTICSRPGLSTIDCVIQPAAFAHERTARTVAFVALGASLALYVLSNANRRQAARAVLLEKKKK